MVVLLISGLLGMHALNGVSSHAATGGPGSGSATIVQAPGDLHGERESVGSAEHCSDGCGAPVREHAPSAPEHAGMAACVLVLLAGLSLLAPPTTGVLIVLRLPRLPVPTEPPGILMARSAPDLTVLSISRT